MIEVNHGDGKRTQFRGRNQVADAAAAIMAAPAKAAATDGNIDALNEYMREQGWADKSDVHHVEPVDEVTLADDPSAAVENAETEELTEEDLGAIEEAGALTVEIEEGLGGRVNVIANNETDVEVILWRDVAGRTGTIPVPAGERVNRPFKPNGGTVSVRLDGADGAVLAMFGAVDE